MRALQRKGGSPDNSWLEQSRPGRNPTAYLQRAPFQRSGYQTPACLVDWSFHCRREVYWGWRVERAISKVGMEGTGFSDINITKNSVLCNKESSLTGVYYKMFDIIQEHVKNKNTKKFTLDVHLVH